MFNYEFKKELNSEFRIPKSEFGSVQFSHQFIGDLPDISCSEGNH